jgi:hypothetical protein
MRTEGTDHLNISKGPTRNQTRNLILWHNASAISANSEIVKTRVTGAHLPTLYFPLHNLTGVHYNNTGLWKKLCSFNTQATQLGSLSRMSHHPDKSMGYECSILYSNAPRYLCRSIQKAMHAASKLFPYKTKITTKLFSRMQYFEF